MTRKLRNVFVPRALGFLLMAGSAVSAYAIIYYNQEASSVTGSGSSESAGTANAARAPVFAAPSKTLTIGSGVLQPFVRILPAQGEDCGVQPCDDGREATTLSATSKAATPQVATKSGEAKKWIYSLRLTDVDRVPINGVLYREFILYINETIGGRSNDTSLSLDKFKLYQASVGTLDNFSVPDRGSNNTDNRDNYVFNGALAIKIYNIDARDATDVRDKATGLSDLLNSGKGSGIDLNARVPDAVFDPTKQSVYLYSSFGQLGINPGQNKPAETLRPRAW